LELIPGTLEDGMTIVVNPDWWKTLFDGLYLKTDARSVCDEKLSRCESEVVRGLLYPEPGHRILDLCGGQGRHSLFLSEKYSARCTVLDFSRHLVRLGHRNAVRKGCPVHFIQGDARSTGLSGSTFDHVIIMGNSLGYLPDPDDDRKILAESLRLLKPGSRILVDVTDGEKARREMAPMAWHEVDEDLVVCRRRELNDGKVHARELVFSRRKGLLKDQSYAIRLFTPSQLDDLLRRTGFVDVRLHRDFRPHDGEGDYGFMNRRVLATAKRPTQEGKAS
jgi:D-alanine-D-alanine ligase